MAVAAISKYEFAPADTQDKFHGAQLLYIGWEDHLLFCAPFCFPFPATMRFGDVVSGPMQAAFGYHPDFARIDWAKVEWLKSGKPFAPGFRQVAGRERPQAQGCDPLPHARAQRHQGFLQLIGCRQGVAFARCALRVRHTNHKKGSAPHELRTDH